VSPLPDGNYNVSVAKPGFALIEFKGIQLMKGESQPLQIILLPGRIQETVTVVGEGVRRSAGQPVPGGPPQRIRVGGNVQAVKLVSKVEPAYPPACKTEGIEGSVVVQAVISKEGDVIKLEVLNQLVDPRLVEAAVEAVKQWKYQPTLLNGAPIEVVTQIDVNFILQK
jgi:TonB family protein